MLTAFRAQVKAGRPITVTHAEVTRFFMTVEEAVQLVVQAGAIGRNGETLVLDMGEPVRIADVAERLAGPTHPGAGRTEPGILDTYPAIDTGRSSGCFARWGSGQRSSGYRYLPGARSVWPMPWRGDDTFRCESGPTVGGAEEE